MKHLKVGQLGLITPLILTDEKLTKIWPNSKKVGGLIRNKPCNSFGFNALRQQHEWV
jgi:hypothetical protein